MPFLLWLSWENMRISGWASYFELFGWLSARSGLPEDRVLCKFCADFGVGLISFLLRIWGISFESVSLFLCPFGDFSDLFPNTRCLMLESDLLCSALHLTLAPLFHHCGLLSSSVVKQLLSKGSILWLCCNVDLSVPVLELCEFSSDKAMTSRSFPTGITSGDFLSVSCVTWLCNGL